MAKPFIAILAIVAGLAGLAIGMAASRGRHLTPQTLISHARETVNSSDLKPVSNSQVQPDMAALVDDDDDFDGPLDDLGYENFDDYDDDDDY